jgi:hypothetical protein
VASLGGEREHAAHQASAPVWEHVSLLARWYYSSFREGELVMLGDNERIPHTRLIRICRKLLAPPEAPFDCTPGSTYNGVASPSPDV